MSRIFLLKAPTAALATTIANALDTGTVQGITTQLVRRQGLHVAGRAGATYEEWCNFKTYIDTQGVTLEVDGDGAVTPFLDLDEGAKLAILQTLAGEYP